MIHLIFGRSGAGKTRYVFEELRKSAKKSKTIVLVPERENVNYERALFDFLGESGSLEVINFRRLAEKFFRENGGIRYNYLSDSAKKVFLWDILSSSKNLFKSYKNMDFSEEKNICDICSFIKDAKRYSVTPDNLMEAANETAEKYPALSNKLYDLSLMYGKYQDLLALGHDDFDDELTRLSNDLENFEYFSGYDVYFDNFQAFTPQELNIIEKISRQADNVYISIGYVPNEDLPVFLWPPKRMHDNIVRMANKAKIPFAKPVFLYELHRFDNEELKVLEAELFSDNSYQKAVYTSAPEHISLVICSDPLKEILFAAGDIKRRVQNGARYKNISVAVNDMETYAPIIASVFEKNGVPFYMSQRRKITSFSIVRFLSSLFDVYNFHWQQSDVIALIKTGFLDISQKDADLFEGYVVKYDIRGKKFYSDKAWSMPVDFDDGEKLRRLNNTKGVLNEALYPFFCALSANDATVASVTHALYTLLLNQKIPEKLAEKAKIEAERGNITAQSEILQIWSALCDALDGLMLTIPDRKCDAALYKKLFFMILNDTDIGTIPAYLDNVTVCDCASLKQGDIDILYVIGANDERFPKAVASKPLISNRERLLLDKIGIEIDKPVDLVLAEELYISYLAVTKAKSDIIFIYSNSDSLGNSKLPSNTVSRLKKLFPLIEARKYTEASASASLYTPLAADQYLFDEQSEVCKQAVIELLSPEDRQSLDDASHTPLYSKEIAVSDEASIKTLKERRLSYSQLEEYAKCPFSYFCKYPLSLKEKNEATLDALKIGSLMHELFEKLFVLALATNEDEKIADLAEKISESYLFDLFGSEISAKNRFTVKLLKNTALKIIEEMAKDMAESDFLPHDYELKIGDGSPIKSLEIPLKNGDVLTVNGKIDRVDTFDGGGKVYIKVVDYKTMSTLPTPLSNKEFGLDLQMMLYLIAIMENGGNYFGGELIAGEIEYVKIRMPDQIISAIDEKKDKLYSTKKLSFVQKDGKKSANYAETRDEVFGILGEKTILLQSGSMPPSPNKAADPCKFCQFFSICMREQAKETDDDSQTNE